MPSAMSCSKTPRAKNTTGDANWPRKLVGRQRENGSWLNENNRWMEGDPALVTAYALLTLSYCRPVGEKA